MFTSFAPLPSLLKRNHSRRNVSLFLRIFFRVPYALTPLFVALTETAGVGASFPFWNRADEWLDFRIRFRVSSLPHFAGRYRRDEYSMRVLLEIRSGSSAARKAPLKLGQPLRIGRAPKADQAFPDDKQMSSLHFTILHDEKGCRIRDLNSTNGTFLNGKKVKEAILQNGDEIIAGRTKFKLRIESESAEEPVPAPRPAPEPRPTGSARSRAPLPQAAPTRVAVPAPAAKPVAPPQPSPKPPVPRTPQERLLALLRKDFQPLYALLDAAREPSVLKVIFESKEEYQSLYEGASGAQLAHFAPYLIRIPEKSPLIQTLISQAWSKSWGVFLTCDQPLKDLRTHFRKLLMVKLPDGKQVNFRYYDPRVLRIFLPTCNVDEVAQFFGPVKQFLIESEDPKLALRFTRGAKGADKKELPLASA